MTTLQSAFDKLMGSTPYTYLAETISKKLQDQGVVLTPDERGRLAAHLEKDPTKPFDYRRWRLWDRRPVTVTLTESDLADMDRRLDEFLEQDLETFIFSATEDISGTVLTHLHRLWPGEARLQRNQQVGFKKRLSERWGRPLDLMRMAHLVAMDIGHFLLDSLDQQPEVEAPQLSDVLLRLHARACQLTSEVTCLLSSGFADGAMARWRTLHEIAVVSFFLKEHGEPLARRYVDHQAVESYRAGCEYQKCASRLGYEPMSDSEVDDLNRAFNHVVALHGQGFKKSYGWAAEVLSNAKPSFRDIEIAAKVDYLRAHYQMASHNVHANPKGIFFTLGLCDETDLLLAGPSDAGLADPGHCTAISLLHVSASLATIRPSLDSLVGLRVLGGLVDEIGEAFSVAERELPADAVDDRGHR